MLRVLGAESSPYKYFSELEIPVSGGALIIAELSGASAVSSAAAGEQSGQNFFGRESKPASRLIC